MIVELVPTTWPRAADFDQRLHPTAKRYSVRARGAHVGVLVKLYHLGMILERNCVGGSFPGWWEWTFFPADVNREEITRDTLSQVKGVLATLGDDLCLPPCIVDDNLGPRVIGGN